MIVEAAVTVAGSRTAVWAVITDIDHAATTFSGVEEIEVLERPLSGLVGLKWRETRILFGKPAAVEKWITDAAEPEYYRARAESDGFVFVSTKQLSEHDGVVTLTESHESQPQTLMARLQMIPMALFFKGVIRKAILQDLHDVNAALGGHRP
ncbi:MAG: SRPBCC family protein [Gemmatimonadales bacterium]|nr:SRPBCC family protein [Gemmatimonadales bacterium]